MKAIKCPILAAAALVPVFIFCLRYDSNPPEIPDDHWTLTRLAEEMTKLGYQCELVDNERYPASCVQGLFLARQDDTRNWDEIVSGRARLQPNLKWSGLVSVTKDFCSMVGEARPEQVTIGPFCLYGDPEEIARITSHFRGQLR
jgi:hypothetical protein